MEYDAIAGVTLATAKRVCVFGCVRPAYTSVEIVTSLPRRAVRLFACNRWLIRPGASHDRDGTGMS